MPETAQPPKIMMMAFVGGLVGGALGSIIVQLICCWLCHMHQLPIK